MARLVVQFMGWWFAVSIPAALIVGRLMTRGTDTVTPATKSPPRRVAAA